MQLKNQEKEFWLFKLRRVNKLDSIINVSGLRGFKFRLVGIDQLSKASNWHDLPNHYAFLQKE